MGRKPSQTQSASLQEIGQTAQPGISFISIATTCKELHTEVHPYSVHSGEGGSPSDQIAVLISTITSATILDHRLKYALPFLVIGELPPCCDCEKPIPIDRVVAMKGAVDRCCSCLEIVEATAPNRSRTYRR